MRLFLSYSFILFSFLQGFGQTLDRPNIDLINVKDGLPASTPTSIIQDRVGFIWISTVDGLTRYDGYNFKTYVHDPENINSIASNVIYTLAEDKSGNIWMGHLGGNLSRLNPETGDVKTFLVFKGRSTDVNKIFCDQNGDLWAAMRGEGLFKFNGKDDFEFVSDLPHLPNNSIREPKWFNAIGSFYQLTQNEVWLGTSNGLYRMELQNKTLTHLNSFNPTNDQFPVSIQAITANNDSILWCGTYGFGLIKYNLTNNTWQSYKFQSGPAGTNNIITALLVKDDDELWVATSGKGFGVFNTKSEKFTFYHEPEDFNTGPVCYGLLKDKLNTLWSISDRGLYKLSEAQNQFYFTKIVVRKSDNGAYYGVTDLIEGDKEWIVGMNYTEGLALVDKDKNISFKSFKTDPRAEPYLLVIDLLKDSNGIIWVSTRDGLYRLTRSHELKKEFIPVEPNPEKNLPYFLNLTETKQGDLWLTSSRHGAFRKSIKTGKWEQFTSKRNALINNRILKVIEDKAGKLWFIHLIDGITLHQPEKGTFTSISHLDGDSTSLVSNRITDATQTSDGRIWVSTVEGLSVYDQGRGKFSSFTARNGLATNNIYSILSDDEDNVWMTTSLGVTVYSKTEKRFRHFNYSDGLRGLTSSFALKKGEHGKMYIITYQGYYTFYPLQVLSRKYPSSNLVVTAVKGDFNKNEEGTIQVSYDQNKLAFEFSSLNFLDPTKNQYSYQMESLDQQWTTSTSHEIVYSGIPSGKYVFKVKNINEESPTQVVIKLEVLTPFWKEWWFMALWLLFLGITGYWLYRMRLNKIRQEEKIKAEFKERLADVELKALRAQMSPHFIFNSLNSINKYIVKSDPETASMYLTKFSKLIRLILDNSNHKIISLEQELSAIRLYIQLESLRFNHKFSYTLAVAPELNPISIGVPPMIIQPFVENAIWHGLLHKDTPGQLDIRIERFDKGIQCVIQDNGIGRERAMELKSKSLTEEKSYGMKITADRLSMLNGSQVSSLEIEDLKDDKGKAAGTRVIVRIIVADIDSEF